MNLSYPYLVAGRTLARWRRAFALLSICLTFGGQSARAELVNTLTIPGESRDLWPGAMPHENRLGYGSDLIYDAASTSFFGLADRGPEGSPSFVTRIQQFSLQVDPATGSIDGFQLRNTIPLKTADGSQFFDGRLPSALHGDPHTLGLSLDPEGLARGPNGNFFIADEYGPSLYEFAPFDNGGKLEARLVRSFPVPDNLIPRDTTGAINYEVSRTTDPAQATGRQSSRGYEGLAITPDGSTLLAIMQDPLHDEGARNDGRRSPNLRIVRFDVATGANTGQFVYPLEDIVDINRRISPDAAFGATNQGRNVGVSSIVAVDGDRFLVIERDGRGLDVENPALADPVVSAVGTKRIYQIDMRQASDVSQISLAGSNALPDGVQPVSKRLLVDIQAALTNAGLTIPAKMEGLAIGPRLQDGQYSLIISTDNDFSTLEVVDPTGADPPTFHDVYTDGTTGPIGGDAQGRTLLPLHLIALRTPSLIAFDGDFDGNGVVDVVDIDRLSSEVAGGQHPAAFDLTTDQRVNTEDLRYFAKYLASSGLGDANLDGQFTSGDLVQVSQAGGYERDVPAVWSQGDWLGDGRFGSEDLVAAFEQGGYEAAAGLARAIPEPCAAVVALLAAFSVILWRR
jgi:hypothetical protein